MPDFDFLQNPLSKQWVILAPRRAKRPDEAKGTEPVCPFCVGREGDEAEVYRLPESKILHPQSQTGDAYLDPDPNWQVRVIPNKFPFAQIHEVIIHSPDHHKSFGELTDDQVSLILQTYRQRFVTHQQKGLVYIFHNHGEGSGESLPHPHSQLAVIPDFVSPDIPRLDPLATVGFGPRPNGVHFAESGLQEQPIVESQHFYVFCPKTSQWPDEVWIAPKERGRSFGEITDTELPDLAHLLNRLVQIMDIRHGHEFPFNFYIYPGGDWYLRLMPRLKIIGGFELGTNIYVNTQDPLETITFIKEHFDDLNTPLKHASLASYQKHA